MDLPGQLARKVRLARPALRVAQVSPDPLVLLAIPAPLAPLEMPRQLLVRLARLGLLDRYLLLPGLRGLRALKALLAPLVLPVQPVQPARPALLEPKELLAQLGLPELLAPLVQRLLLAALIRRFNTTTLARLLDHPI